MAPERACAGSSAMMHEPTRGRRALRGVLGLFVMLTGLPAAAQAPTAPFGDCTGFEWNMTQELALFRTPATSVAAGTDRHGAPRIDVGRLYEVRLADQTSVELHSIGTHHRNVAAPRAGVLTVTPPRAGHYRISADGPVWIDVRSATDEIPSTSFNGHARCALIHKSVDFLLPADSTILIELSESPSGLARLAVTPTPASP